MILVDTSVWVSHFRDSNKHLEDLLLEGQVACHPFIIGELACGHIENRKEILTLLKTLSASKEAMHDEVLEFIDKAGLARKGIGYIDVHLLVSALISDNHLWANDRKLGNAALKLGIKHKR